MNRNAIAFIFAISSLVLLNASPAFANTNTDVDQTSELADARPVQAELVVEDDPELLNDEDIIDVEIFETEAELDQWFEQLESDTAETVYVDEQGNEYYLDESDVAYLGGKARLKKKGPKAQKRGCSAKSGEASWYGPGFHGKKTGNGEIFNQNALTAAHKTIKYGSKVRVTYKGKSVVVRINDAGPYSGGRVIDLSKAAAAAIGLTGPGHGYVTLEIISCGK